VKEEASVGVPRSSSAFDLLFSDITVAPQQHRLDLLAVEWSTCHRRPQAPPVAPPSTSHRCPEHLHGQRYPSPARAQEDLRPTRPDRARPSPPCPGRRSSIRRLWSLIHRIPRRRRPTLGDAAPMARPQHRRGRFRARPSPPRPGRCSSIHRSQSPIHRPRTRSAVRGARSAGSRAGRGRRRGMRHPWPDRNTTGTASAPGRSSANAASEPRGSSTARSRPSRSWHSPVPS
jgi:hypothetical protein